MIPMPATPLIQAAIDADREASLRHALFDLIDHLCDGKLHNNAIRNACYALAEDELSPDPSRISIDPDNFWSGRRLLMQLERLAIRGLDIHILYAGVCGRNVARMAGLLCAVHYKVCGIRPVDIHRAIMAKNSKGIDWKSLMTGVKQTLPAFNIDTALADCPDPD